MFSNQTLTIRDEAAMLALGAQIADYFPKGGLISLHGDLGAGKTTLVRGLLRNLGYALVEPYQIADRAIYHFDLYRLAEPDELEYMGIRDYLQAANLCLIEWPEKAADLLPSADLQIHIQHTHLQRKVDLLFKHNQ
jgi:tRNA threonylcarbamoyladenosine biosynthesis protein TsaE